MMTNILYPIHDDRHHTESTASCWTSLRRWMAALIHGEAALIPGECYLLTGCSSHKWRTARSNQSTSANRSCTAAESVSPTLRTHILPSSSIPVPAFDSSKRLILHSEEEEEDLCSCSTVEQRGTSGGAQTSRQLRWGSVCCADHSAAVNNRSLSWRQIYSGPRPWESDTPHPQVWEGGGQHASMR